MKLRRVSGPLKLRKTSYFRREVVGVIEEDILNDSV